MNLGVTAIVISEELVPLKAMRLSVAPQHHDVQIMQDVHDLIETGSMYSMAEVFLVLWSLHLSKNCELCCCCNRESINKENEDVHKKGQSIGVIEKQVTQLVKDVEHYWQLLDCLSTSKLRGNLQHDLLKEYLPSQKMKNLTYLAKFAVAEVVEL